MPNKRKYDAAFTIVELLIVIVVIGILAAIAIVAYNGIQWRAWQATLASDVKQAIAQLEVTKSDNGSYPATATDIKRSPGTTLGYITLNDKYCLTATNTSGSMHANSNNTGVAAGPCPSASWTFDSNANDNSVYGNDAVTSTNTTLTTDRNNTPNSAYSFSGSGSFVLISHSPSIAISGNQITMAAWVKPTTTVGSNNILSKRNGSNVGGYILHNTTTDKLMAYVYTNTWYSVTSTNSVYSPVVWVHVAAVYNSSTFKAYANGVEVGSSAVSGNINDINTPLTIGGNGGVQSWVGSIDDVRVYDRALLTRTR